MLQMLIDFISKSARMLHVMIDFIPSKSYRCWARHAYRFVFQPVRHARSTVLSVTICWSQKNVIEDVKVKCFCCFFFYYFNCFHYFNCLNLRLHNISLFSKCFDSSNKDLRECATVYGDFMNSPLKGFLTDTVWNFLHRSMLCKV